MKQYLYNIRFKKDYRKVFKEGQVIDFHPGMNLLVGDQGSGKSSLLSFFRKDNDRIAKETVVMSCEFVSCIGLDTEKDNPRTLSYFREGAMQAQVAAMFSSHGQSVLAIMKAVQDAKDKLVFIDEPEAGLSVRSQYKLVDYFGKAIENGCQVILATHSMVLMEAFDTVFNMEQMKWMSSKEYIESCKEVILDE